MMLAARRLRLRQGKHRHRQLDRLPDGLCLDVSPTIRISCRGPIRAFSRTRPPTPWASARVGIRWAGRKQLWVIGGDGAVSTSVSKLESHVGQRHEHQSARARHAGFIPTPADKSSTAVHGQNTKFSVHGKSHSRQRSSGARNSYAICMMPEHVRGADQLRDANHFYKIHHRRQRIRTARRW